MKELSRTYQYGSAALAPEKEWEEYIPEQREVPAHIRERQERIKRSEENARRREHKVGLRRSKLRAFSTCVAVMLISVVLFSFIYLQNLVDASKNNIAKLEDEITMINTLNDATKSRIDSVANLTYVRERAINELGMIYADSSHVVYYETGGSDYMTAY